MQTIDTIKPTILLAIELSASTWLVAARVPGWEKPHLHRIDGGDTAALLALISSLQARAARGLDATIGVVCCFEAGRDGFWLHRLLTAHGVVCHVLEPTSILVNRRARRAKTDRLDAEGMLRVLAAYLRGDHQACSMVRVPTPEEEDAKRTHREREKLVQERQRIENRIEALLFTQGIRKRPSLRSWERDLAVLRTGDGREIPRHLRAELDRLRRRLVMTLELIREVEAERDQAAKTKPQDRACHKIAALSRIRGIGENFAAVLTRPADRELRRHHTNALSERRYGSRSAHQPGGKPAGKDDYDPARLALASLPAWQRAGGVVPRARRHVGRAHTADRHCGHGAQAVDRALALRRDRGNTGWRRDPVGDNRRRIDRQELPPAAFAGGDTGNATVFFFGGTTPPRFR